MQLEGGAFQSLFDEYLYKRYRFSNIQTLGVETGTNKPTKGTPDSYVRTEDGKYILINYGSVKFQTVKKIETDILSCFNTAKLSLEKEKIKKIICGHCSTNIHVEQYNSIIESIPGVEIELIGLDTLSHDLALIYPHIAKEHLGVEIDTNQFFDIDDFVKVYDANGINAPIDCDFLHRKDEIESTCKSICNNTVTILTGPSGIGKTRLALEVCRMQDNKECKVYCVRSNGNLLYEDIKYYVDNPGKYLLFFDDANFVVSLDNVLHTLLTLSDEYEIKILITVRDYAQNRVISAVTRFTRPEIIEIKRFTNEEIKDIVKNDLGIINQDYQEKISEIANGNARLAFLAGIRSVKEGYQAIRNAEDIFKNYYGRIIDEAKLSRDDVIMLFLINIAGPVKAEENLLYRDLKKQYGAEIDENDTIERLYTLELIDWFKNEITKISDQSFGNYITYYVLFEKKWVSIEKIIEIAFPKYSNKVLYALNTLIEIFNSNEIAHYVEKSIISAWNNVPAGQEMSYLEAFYMVDADKSLSIIKKHIDQEKYVDFDIRSVGIDAKKNNHHIITKEIKILGGYKYTEYFDDSIELIMLYFEKRPDLIMDFYFVICDYMLFDKFSWRNKFEKEILLMEKLWEATNEGENYNNSVLYIHIAQYALMTEFTYTENVRNSLSFNIVRMPISFTEEIALLRSKVWKALGILRNQDEYREAVNGILFEVQYTGLDDDNSRAYLQLDFNLLFAEVIDKEKIDFFDARIIDRFKEIAELIDSPVDERYLLTKNNTEFRLYEVLSQRHLFGRSIQEDERVRRENIVAEISTYTLEDYKKLFLTCGFLEKSVYKTDQWFLDKGLDTVFEFLENDSDLYVNVISEYFKENAPFRLNGYRQVKFLLSILGYEGTYKVINCGEYRRKDIWLSLIWECMDERDITDEIVSDYSSFARKNLISENPIVPSARMLKLYGERDKDLYNTVIKCISEIPKLSVTFLGFAYSDEDIAVLIDLFKDDYDSISKIYMNAIQLSDHVDYGGKLFIKIFEHRPDIWKEYVNWIKDYNRHDGNKRNIFELIWNSEKWQECIDYAYSVLVEDNLDLYIKHPAQLLFGKTENEPDAIQDRKKQWLLDKLHENSMNVSSSSKIIKVVVNTMPGWKLDFILEYLKVNKKIEDFKKIYLFPTVDSWSGSEIPLIIDKIQFVQLLKEQLKGVDYIAHRRYLGELCRNLEKRKGKVELSEYIEAADYA